MAFTPKFKRFPGKLAPQFVTVRQLIELYGNPKHTYCGQRNHKDKAAKRKHTQGDLRGDSQIFHGCYVKELKLYLNMDGYHRVEQLAAENAQFDGNAELLLIVHTVETMADAHKLYDQFNSATASKKSLCYFESGLREIDALEEVKSGIIVNGGKATAVQLAAGVKGTLETRGAVVKLARGVRFVNSLNLERAPHENGGSLGAYVAAAQYCADEKLVQEFVMASNMATYQPIRPTRAQEVLKGYNVLLKNTTVKTGGKVNKEMFKAGLAAFATYAQLAKGSASRRGVAPLEVPTSIGDFIQVMQKFNSRK